MTGGFLTVEDVNSILLKNENTNVFHEINTANITDTYDFDDVKYDFCTVSREKTGNDYNYTFKIENEFWKGGYYITDVEDAYVDVEATWDENSKILSFTSSENAVKLYLYLTTLLYYDFELQQLRWKLTSIPKVKANNLPMGISSDFQSTDSDWKFCFEILDGSEIDYEMNVWVGGSTTTSVYGDGETLFFYFNPSGLRYYEGLLEFEYKNTNYIIIIPSFSLFPLSSSTSNLLLGKVNEFIFEYPSFSINHNARLSCIVKYLDKTIETYCENKFLFTTVNLDLSGIYDLTDLIVSVYIPAYDFEYKFNFTCSIPLISNSVSALRRECGVNGSSIVYVRNNFNFGTLNCSIKHDMSLIGNNNTNFNLNNRSLVVEEGVTAKFKGINFVGGSPAIIQKKGSHVELEDCTFNHCSASDYNNLGSCVYCDVDTESLNVPDDFVTVIDNCVFTDNHSCILHSGKLTVTNCKYHNTDSTYLNKYNVAFLYQTDGRATLKYNIFDIDYDTDSLCSNEEDIGFAQALIQCGLTARINGADSTQLLEDNKLPFSDNVYQNASHIFAKYYYPQIEACVYVSPELDKEDKAVCYCVSGENWVYKQNVQITRASWNSQNEIRKITWE